MIHIKSFFVLLLVLVSTNSLIAQDFQVPTDVNFQTDQDFKNAEVDVVKAVNWLENTPVNMETDKRKDVNSFLMKWMTGTPNVSIELAQFQTDLTDKNPDLLMIYMAGWSKYAIENPSESSNKLECNLAGVKSVLKIYSNNVGKGVSKNKKIEKMLKMNDEELKAFVVKEII